MDKHLHAMAQSIDEQLVVVSQVCPSHSDHIVSSVHSAFLAQVYSKLFQVLVADINIGYEDIVNNQVRESVTQLCFFCKRSHYF